MKLVFKLTGDALQKEGQGWWIEQHMGALRAYHRVNWCWYVDSFNMLRFVPCILQEEYEARLLHALPPSLADARKQRDWWVAYTEMQDPSAFAGFNSIAERAAMDLASVIKYAVYFDRMKRGQLWAMNELNDTPFEGRLTHFRAHSAADRTRHTHELEEDKSYTAYLPKFLRRWI